MRSSLPASRHSRFLILALAASALAGCELMPLAPSLAPDQPKPSAGAACQERCVRPKDECEKRQTLREQDCQERAKKTGPAYASCTANNGRGCPEPVPCLGADLSICQTEYDDCVRDCEATKDETAPVGRREPAKLPDESPAAPNKPS